MTTKLFRKTIKKIALTVVNTVEQNTVYVDLGFENEFQYKNSFIGVPLLLIQ